MLMYMCGVLSYHPAKIYVKFFYQKYFFFFFWMCVKNTSGEGGGWLVNVIQVFSQLFVWKLLERDNKYEL